MTMTKGTEKLFGIDAEFEVIDELTESADGVAEDWFHQLKTIFDAGQAAQYAAAHPAPETEPPKPYQETDYVIRMVTDYQKQHEAAAVAAAAEPETVQEPMPETVPETVTAQHKMLNWFSFILGMLTGGAAVAIPVVIAIAIV